MATTKAFALEPGGSDATAGTAHRITNYESKSVIAHVEGAGSFLIQVSNDGTNWVTVGAAITIGDVLRYSEDTTAPLPKSVNHIRIFTTTFEAASTFSFHGIDPNG